jgi:hypothetical protein
VRSRDEQPAKLGELLNTLAGRLRKVDLRDIDEIRNLWPSVVEPVIAEHCRPEFVKNGVLLVSVPSGAFAQRVMSDATTILEGFSTLGTRAPKSLRTVLERPEKCCKEVTFSAPERVESYTISGRIEQSKICPRPRQKRLNFSPKGSLRAPEDQGTC